MTVNPGLYLLVVLDAHADGVDENSNHDASVEILALHDGPQLHPGVVPQLPTALLRTTSPMSLCFILVFLVLLFHLLHRALLVLCAGATTHRPRSVSEGQGFSALRAGVRGVRSVGFVTMWTTDG